MDPTWATLRGCARTRVYCSVSDSEFYLCTVMRRMQYRVLALVLAGATMNPCTKDRCTLAPNIILTDRYSSHIHINTTSTKTHASIKNASSDRQALVLTCLFINTRRQKTHFRAVCAVVRSTNSTDKAAPLGVLCLRVGAFTFVAVLCALRFRFWMFWLVTLLSQQATLFFCVSSNSSICYTSIDNVIMMMHLEVRWNISN